MQHSLLVKKFTPCPRQTMKRNRIYRNAFNVYDVDHNILFDYVDLYSKYICVHDVQRCLSSAFIPPLQEQIDVVRHFNDILHDVRSVHDLQGVILKLTITHDDVALDTLVSTIQQYNNNIHIIRDIVEYANAASLPTNQDNSITL